MDVNTIQHNTIKPLKPTVSTPEQLVADAEKVRETFQQFVGEAFYGQMLKSMRSTLGKPAYFHGGHAEEVFRGQLDQVLAEQMTEASADTFADPMFRQQFPRHAALLEAHKSESRSTLSDLSSLRRR